MQPAFVALSDGQLRSRMDKLSKHLDNWGDVEIQVVGRRVRMVEFRVSSPGYPCAEEAQSLFREYYRWESDEWQIAKYTYEYRDVRRGTRLAYHLHPLGGTELVPHAHCGSGEEPDEGDLDDGDHRRATVYELIEANAIFMRLYSADLDPDCSSFLSLELPPV